MARKMVQVLVVVVFLQLMIISANSQSNRTVWAVDFVKTKQNRYEDYLKYLQANWVKAREEAKNQGFIISYRLLALPINSENDWDILLITEYKDSKQFEIREENFRRVFAKIRGTRGPTLINGLGARDLADIKFSKELSEMKSEVNIR